jgi:L-fuconolactonase
MKIDAHQHFWRYDPDRDRCITERMERLKRDFLPEELMEELARNEIEGSIAVQADQSERETRFLLQLAERPREIKGVVGWVDLRAPDVGERLHSLSQIPKLVGFRHIVQSEPDDRFLLRQDFCRGIRQLAACDFTYDIVIYPRQLPAAIELARMFPEQRFLLDHLAKPRSRPARLPSGSPRSGPWRSSPMCMQSFLALLPRPMGTTGRKVTHRPTWTLHWRHSAPIGCCLIPTGRFACLPEAIDG